MSFILAELLTLLPARSLRAIATHLGVRRREQADKAAWRAAILAYWQQPPAPEAVLAPAVYAAYAHLRGAGQLPAALFWAEYGALRLPAADAAAVSPWQAPQTISEALYYRGLLYPIGHRQIQKASWLTTPIDLTIVDPLTVGPLTTGGADTPTSALGRAVNVWPLLHDVAQYLIYRQQQPTLALLHDYWLPASHLQALNRRLLQPAAAPLPRSHKATPVLAWLTFLAQAAGLIDATGITARGWQWLAETPAYQLQALWHGWRTAAAPLRTRHEQPDAFLPPPWPQPLLQWLGQQQAAFSAQQAAAYLLGTQPALADYFVAHLAAASDLAQLLAPLLAFDLCQLGLLTALDAAASPAAALMHDPHRLYTLSAIGAWLLHPTLAPPVFGPVVATPGAADPPPLHLPGLLTVPVELPFTLQARLAAYADYSPAVATADSVHTQHTYAVTAATVARAAAYQQPLSVLVATLHALRGPLDHAQMSWLQAAYAAGRTLQLAYLPILRSDSPARMAALQQDDRLDDLWGELLGPTAVTLLAALPEVHTRLQQAGYSAPVPLPELVEGNGTGAPAAAEPPMLVAPALLWLAGRLYQLLGEHVPTLAPLPSAALEQLRQQLDPTAQAVVQSQFEQMHTQLGQLLDGYHLMPPTIPALYAVDSAARRQQLESALAARQALHIHYYTAGRNLLTERKIEPYWLEERHDSLYLRAYCHQAGRVLIFRVDRIQAVAAIQEA